MITQVSDVDVLLAKWEETYKKGLLSFWVLLYLSDQASYAYEISNTITSFSEGTISAGENSIYRALNRFEDMGLVQSELRDSELGPKRRYYDLTAAGIVLLQRFIERNILVLQSPTTAERIQSVLAAIPKEQS